MLRDYTIRADVMKRERTKKRMSQQRLAEKARLSLGQVSRIESGRTPSPHFPTIEKLAAALDLDPNDLIEIHLELR
jgi:transcriptional regulator with XRE-family HTH domain